MGMTYPAGMQMFSADDTEDMIEEAKQYCRRLGLTMHDAVLGTKDGFVSVTLKRTVTFDDNGLRTPPNMEKR